MENMVNQMTDFVNSFNRTKNETFCKEMSNEHRTLQQSFTRLCLEWLEFVSSDDYRTDLRNVESHKTCKLLMELYRHHMSQRFSGPTLDLMSRPSKSLPLV